MLIPQGASLLRVDWLVAGEASLVESPGRIGLSACPGRPDLGGTVEDDVAKLVALGISVVVTLVEDQELEFYGIFGLRNALRQAGILSLQFPIYDAEPPTDLSATRALCTEILRWAGEGRQQLIHCIGGWGRSGTIAASLLIHEGHPPEEAIALVRRARSPRCVESLSQERFVAQYAASHKGVRRFFVLLPRTELATRFGGEAGNRRLRRGSRPELPLLSAKTLRTALSAQSDQRPLVILSGEATPEQFSSDLDLLIDRAYYFDGTRWQTAPLSSLHP